MKKIIEPTGECCVRFSEEELTILNIKEGDKFSIEESEDGILLKKYEELDIDLSEFSREILEFIIIESNKLDLTISEYMEYILTNYVKDLDKGILKE
jgi:bifunctional DNA-binding transcriptional regulator/antitoxin component of YhaV-PrlF toxin-antitoxin module